jgi:hypothetical protein
LLIRHVLVRGGLAILAFDLVRKCCTQRQHFRTEQESVSLLIEKHGLRCASCSRWGRSASYPAHQLLRLILDAFLGCALFVQSSDIPVDHCTLLLRSLRQQDVLAIRHMMDCCQSIGELDDFTQSYRIQSIQYL